MTFLYIYIYFKTKIVKHIVIEENIILSAIKATNS